MSHRFSIVERIRSFRFAIRGVAVTLQSQHNAWIHLVVSAVVIATRTSWCCDENAAWRMPCSTICRAAVRAGHNGRSRGGGVLGVDLLALAEAR